MTIHAMFVYNKKILIDKILYDDIFNYLDDQGEHISKEKLYEHEKENCPDLEVENIAYDFALNLRQVPCYNSHISVTRSLAVSYIPHCIMPMQRKLYKSRENGYGGNNIYSISAKYVYDYSQKEFENHYIESDRCDSITFRQALLNQWHR